MRQKVVQGCGSVSCALLFIFSIKVDMPLCVLISNLFHVPSQAENCAFAASCRWVAMELRPGGLSKVLPNRITSSTCSLFLETCLSRLQLGLISLFKSHLTRSSETMGVMGINQFVALLVALIEKFLESGIGRGLMNKSPNRSASYRGLIFSFL